MNERCVRTGLAGVMIACSVLLGGQLVAAENQHGEGESNGRMIPITRNDAMELSRAAVQIQRRAIVTANLQLTEGESERFWPIYRVYWAEREGLNDRLAKLIKTYAENYQVVTDEQAQAMLDEFLSIKQAEFALKQQYVDRFGEVLSPIKLARYYQIENKLDSIVNYDLARTIPLVN